MCLGTLGHLSNTLNSWALLSFIYCFYPFLLQNTKIFNNNVALVCWFVVNLSFCHSFIVEDLFSYRGKINSHKALSFAHFALQYHDFLSFLASTEDIDCVQRVCCLFVFARNPMFRSSSSAFAFHLLSLSLLVVSWLCYRYTRSRGSQPGDLSVSRLWCDPSVPGACPQWAWLPRRSLFS